MPEAHNLKVTRCTYAEEADDVANKVSQRPEAHPAGERKVNIKISRCGLCHSLPFRKVWKP